uniref:Uncharacterized protein n=1 Tax=Romanomermis culicivorax TaxID=13658 RepID=A0A915II04_ROMCU
MCQNLFGLHDLITGYSQLEKKVSRNRMDKWRLGGLDVLTHGLFGPPFGSGLDVGCHTNGVHAYPPQLQHRSTLRWVDCIPLEKGSVNDRLCLLFPTERNAIDGTYRKEFFVPFNSVGGYRRSFLAKMAVIFFDRE